MDLRNITGNSNLSNKISTIQSLLNKKIEKITGNAVSTDTAVSMNYQALMPAQIFGLTYSINGVRKNLQSGMNVIESAKEAYAHVNSLIAEAENALKNYINNTNNVSSINDLNDKIYEISNELNYFLNNTKINRYELFGGKKKIISEIVRDTGTSNRFYGDMWAEDTFTFNGISANNDIDFQDYSLTVGFDNNISYSLENVYGQYTISDEYKTELINAQNLKTAGDLGIFVTQHYLDDPAQIAQDLGVPPAPWYTEENSIRLAADPIPGTDIDDKASFFNDAYIELTDGNGYYQRKKIKSYNAAEGIIQIYGSWNTTDGTAQKMTSAEFSADKIKLDANSPYDAVDLTYTNATITITGGPLAGQSKTITSYDNATGLATLSSNWTADSETDYAAGGSNNTIVLGGSAATVDDYYNDSEITITNGVFSETKTVVSYDGTTKTATFSSDWTTVTNTAQAGSSTTNVILNAGDNQVDDYYNGASITVNGETKTILDYDSASNTATVDSAFSSTTSSQNYDIDFSPTSSNNMIYTADILAPNASSTYTVTFNGEINKPTAGTEYKITYSALSAINLDSGSADYGKIYNLGSKLEKGSYFDIAQDPNDATKYFLAYSDGERDGASNTTYRLKIFHGTAAEILSDQYLTDSASVTVNSLDMRSKFLDIENNFVFFQNYDNNDLYYINLTDPTYTPQKLDLNEATLSSTMLPNAWYDENSDKYYVGFRGVTQSGNVQSQSDFTTLQLDAAASAEDDFYNNQYVYITSGTGQSQARLIVDYDGATRTATIDSDWGDGALEGTAQIGSTTNITKLDTTTTSDYTDWYIKFTSGALDGVSRKITAYNTLTKEATLDSPLAVSPDGMDYILTKKLPNATSTYEISSLKVAEVDPNNALNNQIIINASPNGETYTYNNIENGYLVENYYSGAYSVQDKINLINLNPYKAISDNDINAQSGSNLDSNKVHISVDRNNFEDTYKYIVGDNLTFNMVDETTNTWDVYSQKYGFLGQMTSGIEFQLGVNPVSTTSGDSELEIASSDTNDGSNTVNSSYVLGGGVSNPFLKLKIDTDTYKFGDNFTLEIKDAVIQKADLGTSEFEKDSIATIDEFGGIFFKTDVDQNTIELVQSIIDYDSAYDSNSTVNLTKIIDAAGDKPFKGFNLDYNSSQNSLNVIQTSSTKDDNTIFFQFKFNNNFHNTAGEVGVDTDIFGTNTVINSDSTYLNEKISLVYDRYDGGSDTGIWKAYSNQSGYLGEVSMAKSGYTSTTLTKTGSDGGKTNITLELNGWQNITGNTEATSDDVFISGDTIKVNASKKAFAQFGTGEKVYVNEGKNYTLVDETGSNAVNISWANKNFDYYNLIKEGNYTFTVGPNIMTVVASENIDKIQLDVPNSLSLENLEIDYDTIKNKSVNDALANYVYAKTLVSDKISRIDGDSELLNGALNFSNNRLDTLLASNDKINNSFEAKLKLNKIKDELTNNFEFSKYINLKSEIVDGLFSFLDKTIKPFSN